MSTMSINASTVRPGTVRGRLGLIPWLTVVPLAVVMAYADGFWLTTLRGAVGSIERTQSPFTSWLRESTLALPVFVLAVLGALALAGRWFGPALRKPKTIVAAALLVVVAGTLVGIAALAASSGYDYYLQSHEQTMKSSMHMLAGSSVVTPDQASRALQLRAVGYGSVMLLATNVVLVGWVVALKGGRIGVIKTSK
jgi:hypothetical protein